MSMCHPKSLYFLFKQYYSHLYFITRAYQHTIRQLKASNTLTWHIVQWKWFIGTSVPTCACNCGSVTWGSCTKVQRGDQATLVPIIAHNFCAELSPGGGTCVVHGPLSKSFISPEKSRSLSEGDFLHGTSISSGVYCLSIWSHLIKVVSSLISQAYNCEILEYQYRTRRSGIGYYHQHTKLYRTVLNSPVVYTKCAQYRSPVLPLAPTGISGVARTSPLLGHSGTYVCTNFRAKCRSL